MSIMYTLPIFEVKNPSFRKHSIISDETLRRFKIIIIKYVLCTFYACVYELRMLGVTTLARNISIEARYLRNSIGFN